jgi:methylenetetrahydrofolate dehydrogenase (NADP+)/methenyltetrahydrofolate cyclohydrolase
LRRDRGRSNIVGKPMAALMMQTPGGNATVTVCHRHTGSRSHTRQADILIVAIGKPGFVTGDMVKPGAVVIDVGINRVDDPSSEAGLSGWSGDVDFSGPAATLGARRDHRLQSVAQRPLVFLAARSDPPSCAA